jgi:hypothetical protein
MAFNISGVKINGVNIYDSLGLYTFYTFTFLDGNISGQRGPTGAQLFANSYTSNVGNTWIQNTSYYNTYGNGFQFWTVPATGNYQITAAGARGGIPFFNFGAQQLANGNATAGYGAVVSGTFTLNQGQILSLVVGQPGGNAGVGATYSSTGGGGASWVVTGANVALLVAGGGGGGGNFQSGVPNSVKGGNGVTRTSGGSSFYGAPGGANGIGGNSHVNGAGTVSVNGYDAGGGGGLYANGVVGTGANSRTTISGVGAGGGGGAYIYGANGGTITNETSYLNGISPGGFGGGGAPGPITGGGGGGYSGGAGTYGASGTSTDAGGGGGSYIDSGAINVSTSDGLYNNISTFNGSSISNLAFYNYAHGYITITKV